MRRALSILLLLCFAIGAPAQFASAHKQAVSKKKPAGGGGGGCVSAYRTNDVFFGGTQAGVGTGDRTSPLTGPAITATMILSGTPSDAPWLADNNFANGQAFFDGGTASRYVLQVDFGSGNSYVVTELTWFQQTADSHGTWQVEGSNDGSSWTTIGGAFTLGGAATEAITTVSGNTTAYRYYHLKGVSGNTSSNPWLYELWIKNCQ